jgi:hypothetical protein
LCKCNKAYNKRYCQCGYFFHFLNLIWSKSRVIKEIICYESVNRVNIVFALITHGVATCIFLNQYVTNSF